MKLDISYINANYFILYIVIILKQKISYNIICVTSYNRETCGEVHLIIC